MSGGRSKKNLDSNKLSRFISNEEKEYCKENWEALN